MFDTADVYSQGMAEEILGAAIKGRREQVIISTKGTFRTGTGPNEVGSSRHYLIRACEATNRWASSASAISRENSATGFP